MHNNHLFANFRLTLIIVIVALFMLPVASVLAATASGSGTIDTGSPIASPGNCGSNERYVAEGSFTLSADGPVTATITSSQSVTLLVGTVSNDITSYVWALTATATNSTSLSAGTYYLFVVDCEAIYYNAFTSAAYSYSVSYDVSTSGGSKVVVKKDTNDDPDGDGISGSRDNCPHAYNPGQEDGWGSAMGDACDTDWYNMSGIGIAGFEQKDGMYHLHGNCTFMADGDPRCPEIGIFDPSSLTPEAMPMEITTEFAGTWSVWMYFLYTKDGVDVYQVNVYSTNPPQPDTLLDDRLELHVNANGSWQWYQRGGSSQYHGI